MLYARMEEVSFRSGAAVAGGVLTAAGVAITLAVVLGGHSDAAASAPASRVAVPSVTLPSPAPVSSSSSPSPTAAPPDEGLRGRGRGLPAAIGDPGVRDPASGGTDSGQYPYSAPAGSAFPGVSGAAARRVGQRAAAVAVALRPVTASHRWCHSDRSVFL
jgi:hypothetical protein